MNKRTPCRVRWQALIVIAVAALPGALSAQQSGNAAPVGDAARGKPLFADTYNCYACHGLDAQTGERRLVPMIYPQEAFIAFVQNSPLPQMPAFPDVPAQDLADIYAYIRSLPADAPAVTDIPLLQAIRDRKRAAFERR